MAKGKKTGGRNFKKRQSGNPKGRPPKGETIKDALEFYRDATKIDIVVTDKEGKKHPVYARSSVPFKFALAGTAWMRALAGDIDFIEYVTERLEGKSKQQIEAAIASSSSQVDLSKLTDKELEQFELMMAKMATGESDAK